MTYRIAEHGVERIEDGHSTFIHPDLSHPAWREYEAWRGLGHQPVGALERPRFPKTPEPKKLWIIGAGGYGREIFGMTESALGKGSEWQVAGFLNDITDSLDGFEGLLPILGGTDYQPQPDDVFICAIGEVPGRKAVGERFRARGARFVNLVQRSAMVSPTVEFGEGIVIEAFSGVGANARIGDFSTILSHVSIGHDAALGSFVQVSPFASILGRTVIGDEVMIGSHAVIFPDVKIGAGAKVGAGSVVIRDVPAGATVFGVPATRIQ